MAETLNGAAYPAAAPGTSLASLRRGFLTSLVANIPMLVLLLIPQLMRSRAGSEALLFVGTGLYIGLVAVALMTAAPVSAGPHQKQTCGLPAPQVNDTPPRRTEPRECWRRAGEWFLLFVIAQAVGFSVGWLIPYVRDNPDFVTAGEPRWLIRYDRYALHAVTIYLFSCLSFAWFGTRLRQLALAARERRSGREPPR